MKASTGFGRSICGDLDAAERREWLVTNGLGGSACGTVAGTLTRRYHGLLIAALDPPLGRTLLVAKLNARATYEGWTYDLEADRFGDGTIAGNGWENIERFYLDGTTPVWEYALGDALLEKRICMAHGSNETWLRYRVLRAGAPIALRIRALVNYRDFHGNTHRAPWTPGSDVDGSEVTVEAFPGATPYRILARDAEFRSEGVWYYDYRLEAETERGLDDRDDHFSLGVFERELCLGESLTFVVSADESSSQTDAFEAVAARERALLEGCGDTAETFARLTLAADQFIVSRATEANPAGKSVIAGYPWFGDWGRDTMIALPGLTLATGRLETARAILRSFAGFVDEGMLPNVLPATGETPEYNSVDAPLWFIEAVAAYAEAAPDDRATLLELLDACAAVVDAYERGTRFGIGVDADGLVRAGVPGVQLTWMDAKVGDRVITPRIGKPIEISALWYNALLRLAAIVRRYGRDASPVEGIAAQTREGFARFWNAEAGYCYDVIDGPDGADASLRPNQLFAVALPHSPLDPDRQRAVVRACSRALLAGPAIRSLDPADARYVGRYVGSLAERDAAYHQGTSWLWLLGVFAIAHFRAFGDAAAARAFLAPLDDALCDGGVGTLGELADGDAPFVPRGAIAQAWSVAEALRAYRLIDGA